MSCWDSGIEQNGARPPYWRIVAEPVAAAGQDLVRVGLVADVPEDLVARRVEQAVQRDRQLAGAEVGAEVAADLADRVDDQLAGLLGDLLELLVVERPGGRRDRRSGRGGRSMRLSLIGRRRRIGPSLDCRRFPLGRAHLELLLGCEMKSVIRLQGVRVAARLGQRRERRAWDSAASSRARSRPNRLT